MLDCLDALGVEVRMDADVAHVGGTAGVFRSGPVRLETRLAGTTSRFTHRTRSARPPGPVTVDGEPPLRRRPMAPLHDALVALGADLTWGETRGHLPVTLVR